jgi:hypothetical protein
MSSRYWPRLLAAALLCTTSAPPVPVNAQESEPGTQAAASLDNPSPADKALLDAMVRDFGLSLSRADDSSLRVPLTPKDWSFNGLRPYAALGTRTLRPVTDGLIGLALPSRESTDEFSHGLGVGAGLEWQLTGRLGLFGEYLFQKTSGTNGPSNIPTLRPGVESPVGLKGGLSIRF